MEVQTMRKFIAILILCLFLVGTAQIGFSKSGSDTEHISQAAETRTSFDPFMDGWAYRKQITIDHTKVAGDLTDFPVLVSITDTNLGTKTQSDGDDILFMDSVGTAQQLNHEIEIFDDTSGTLVAWVEIPSLSSSEDSIFYLYYGNSDCNNQQHSEEVWTSSFVAVWHLNNNPTGQIYDSTINKNNGESQGAMTTSDLVNGKVGSCLDFDGIDDFVSFSEFTDSYDTGTCIAWVQTTSTERGVVWGEATETAIKPYILCGKHYDDDFWFARDVSGGTTNYQGFKPLSMNDGQWHQAAWSSSGSGNGNKFYFDGQPITVDWQDGRDPNGMWFDDQTTNTHSIANIDRSVDDCLWSGRLDEIRIVNAPLSGIWIATEFANQNNPSNFMSFGPEESIPFVKTIIFGKITNLNTGGNSLTFNAVKLHSIQFSPFSYNTYFSNERFLVANGYRGLITPKMALAICQVYT